MDLNLNANSNTIRLQADAVNIGQASTDITTVTGELRVTQDIVAFYSSDRRLKYAPEQIADSLSKCNQLTGYEYFWNEHSPRHGQHDYGVIAQELQLVMPELVHQREDGYLAVDYQKIIPLLINAINELNDKVVDLERRLEDN